MPTKQSRKEQEEALRKVKREAKANREANKAAALRKQQVQKKRSEATELRKAAPRGTRGVLVTAADTKALPEELRAELEKNSGTTTPPHRHEVHIKKSQITVYVSLHNVPPQKIDADATTDKCLVVETPKHTKHYRLEFTFPHGMVVDAAKGDYTYEDGILSCVFPVTKMPAEVEREWNERLESVRKSQRARFEVTKEGDLVVRRRKTTLELKAKAAKRAEKAATAGKTEKKTATVGESAEKKARKPGPGEKDDKAAMLRMVEASANKVNSTLRERLSLAKEAHARRLARAGRTEAKKSTKQDVMYDAFSRVVEAKRAALQASQPQEAPRKKAAAGTPKKSVRFSA